MPEEKIAPAAFRGYVNFPSFTATLTGLPSHRCRVCRTTILDVPTHVHEVHVDEAHILIPGRGIVTIARNDRGHFQCPVCSAHEVKDGRLLQVSCLPSRPFSTTSEIFLSAMLRIVNLSWSSATPQTPPVQVHREILLKMTPSHLLNILDRRMLPRLRRFPRTPRDSILLPTMKPFLTLRMMLAISFWTMRLSRGMVTERATNSDQNVRSGLRVPVLGLSRVVTHVICTTT